MHRSYPVQTRSPSIKIRLKVNGTFMIGCKGIWPSNTNLLCEDGNAILAHVCFRSNERQFVIRSTDPSRKGARAVHSQKKRKEKLILIIHLFNKNINNSFICNYFDLYLKISLNNYIFHIIFVQKSELAKNSTIPILCSSRRSFVKFQISIDDMLRCVGFNIHYVFRKVL